jgi:hypothetical protein
MRSAQITAQALGHVHRPAGDVVPDEDLEDARRGEPIQLGNLTKRAALVRVKRTGFNLLCVGQAAMRSYEGV